MIDKVAPFSLEAEQSVIGGLMLADGMASAEKCLTMLSANDFAKEVHRLIFDAIRTLNKNNAGVDLVTVSDALEEKGKLNAAGGFAYLAEIAKNTPTSANLLSYAWIVKQKAQKRRLIEHVTQALNVAWSDTGDSIEKQLDDVYSQIEGFADHIKSGNRKGLIKISDVMGNVLDDMQKRIDGHKFGITTGIKSLDNLLAPKGLVNHGLCVIGARPKMGKTSTALAIVEHVAITLNKPAAVFSMEMTNEELGEKLITQISGVTSNYLYDERGMENEHWSGVVGAVAKLNNDNIYVCDTPQLKAREIISECRKLKRERGEIGIIMIDYLTLMDAGKAERNDLAYGAITKAFKSLAKELNTPVVLLTQLNRGIENRPNKRPKPSDSRDTGQIEQDCDYWIGLYRDEYYNPEEQTNKGVIELGVELNRHGENGVALAGFDRGRVVNLKDTHVYIPAEEAQKSRTSDKNF